MIELAEIARIQREAAAMLSSLTDAAAIVRALQPRAEDYPRVFTPPAATRALEAYKMMWTTPPPSFGKPGQTQVLAFACDAESLATENEFSDRFPGGYRRIAHLLVPTNVWVAFKFVEPGKTLGMAYDGLVQLGDRWAWFPKPWRFVAEPTATN